MKNINFTYLKYFFDSCIHKSISNAARDNFVSQSAISQGISKLEVALQVKLTTHQKQVFRLTEEGEFVFKEAKLLFSQMDQIQEGLNLLKGEISGDVKFACTNSLAQFYLPSFYLKMRRDYPKVDLKFHRGSLKYIHEALRSEKVQFAIVLDGREFEGYERVQLLGGSFKLYRALGSKGHSGMIVDHPENEEVIEFRARYEQRFCERIEIMDALSGWGLVAKFIQLGYGQGLLPEFIGKEMNDLEEVDLDIPPIKYSICMIKTKGSPLTRAERAFLNILAAS